MESVLRFVFELPVDPKALEGDVALAIFATECLYGKLRVRVETGFLVEPDGSSCAIRIQGAAGHAVAKIFAGFAAARLGEDGYRVHRQKGRMPSVAAATGGGS